MDESYAAYLDSRPDERDSPAFGAWCDRQQLELIKRSLPVASRKNKIAASRVTRLRVKAANKERHEQLKGRVRVTVKRDHAAKKKPLLKGFKGFLAGLFNRK